MLLFPIYLGAKTKSGLKTWPKNQIMSIGFGIISHTMGLNDRNFDISPATRKVFDPIDSAQDNEFMYCKMMSDNWRGCLSALAL